MPNAVPLGILGFVAGLTQAIEKLNQRNRDENLRLLEAQQRSGNYELAPAAPHELRPAGFWQRLMGGTPYLPTSEGQPVIPYGSNVGQAVTLKAVPRFSLQDYDFSRIPVENERASLRTALQAFEGVPLTTTSRRDIARVRHDVGLEFTRGRLQADREQARAALVEQKEFDRARRQLLSLMRGQTDATLIQAAKDAVDFDDLVELYSQLPSPVQLKAAELEVLGPLRTEEAVNKAKALLPLQQQRQRPPAAPRLSQTDLALLASGDGPEAEKALRALKLLHSTRKKLGITPADEAGPEWEGVNLTELALMAQGEGPQAERAKAALSALEKLKATSAKRRRGQQPERATPEIPPVGTESPSGPKTYQGQSPPQGDLPQIRGFRKVN